MGFLIRYYSHAEGWLCLVREEQVKCGSGRPVLASGLGPTREAARLAAIRSTDNEDIQRALSGPANC